MGPKWAQLYIEQDRSEKIFVAQITHRELLFRAKLPISAHDHVPVLPTIPTTQLPNPE